MAEKGESRSNRALKEATGLIAVLAWTLLLGAAITTARMIAIRYAAFLLPRRQREAAEQAESPGTSATSA